MKCIFKASSVFARGYGIRATGSVDSSGETTLDANVLPGEDFEQAHRMHNQALRLRETVRQNQRTMRNMQRDLARGRQGSLSELRPQKAGFAAELLGLPPPPRRAEALSPSRRSRGCLDSSLGFTEGALQRVRITELGSLQDLVRVHSASPWMA